MVSRMVGECEDTLAEYLEKNKELVDDISPVIRLHYSDKILNSDLARTRFVKPDIMPIASPDAV